MQRREFALGAAALAAAPTIAAAAPLTLSAAIARLFTAVQLQSAWFSAPFLAEVPLEKARAIVNDVTGALGPYQSIVPNRSRFTVAFARGTIQAEGHLDDAGAFTSLLFSRMQSPLCAQRIAALFHTNPIPAAWFSDAMLAAAPIATIRTVTKSLTDQFGAFVSTTPAKDGTYDVEFANGSAAFLIFLGADGKIEGLIAQPH